MIPLIVAGVVGAIGGATAVKLCSSDDEKNILDKCSSHKVNIEKLSPSLKEKLRKAK